MMERRCVASVTAIASSITVAMIFPQGLGFIARLFEPSIAAQAFACMRCSGACQHAIPHEPRHCPRVMRACGPGLPTRYEAVLGCEARPARSTGRAVGAPALTLRLSLG
jgi:hypothetical protein